MLPDIIALSGNVLLFALVFGMSATVEIECIMAQIRNVKALLTGVFCQFVVLPFLGYLVVRALKLEPQVGIPLLVVTSSPGGSYSNWWCSLFNADLALSVTMTAISTILSVVTLPVNLLFYTKISYHRDVTSSLDWTSLFTALAIVISAIAMGLFCSANIKTLQFNRMANRIGNVAGLSLIIFSATMTNTGSSDSKIYSRTWDFYVGVALPCLGGLILSNLMATGCRLHRPERVTVAIECCYQNVGIATSLALTMFDGDDLNMAIGVPFFYGVVEAFLVGTYCLGAWKAGWTKAPADAPFWNVLWTSYEIVQIIEQEENINNNNTNSDYKIHNNDYESSTSDKATRHHHVKSIEVGMTKSRANQADHYAQNTLTHYYNAATCCATVDTTGEDTIDSTKAIV